LVVVDLDEKIVIFNTAAGVISILIPPYYKLEKYGIK